MDEIQALLGEVREAYGWFGLTPRFAFATKPDKAIGDPALWERAEQLIREAFAAADISYDLKPKDGTFYAPKIDIYIDDALGREWQMATIQVDLAMLPERFDLTYIDENGQPQRPIAIHRAIYGSLERFIGILVEHFAGAFPLWVRPVQAVVIPIADRHMRRGRELAGVLRRRGLRVEVDVSDNRMQNKIRLAQGQKVPYMMVLGDREIEARTASRSQRGARRAADGRGLGRPRRSAARRRAGRAGGLIRPRRPPSVSGGPSLRRRLIVWP
jgi:threonyl-tRNA synthetase